MGELADKLGGKISGELIRSNDWNQLIDHIEGNEKKHREDVTLLTESIATISSRVETLHTQIENLENVVENVRTSVEILEQRFYRLTLRTERVNYALGEMALLTARLTRLNDEPLENLANSVNRPWVDFVAAWGQLKAAAGFTSRDGAVDRTISVQVNAQGEAQVLLRAEHTEGFTDEEEDEVSGTLKTMLPENNNRSIAQSFLEAATPMEANVRGAFKTMSKEYDRSDGMSVRQYVDAFYIRNPINVVGQFSPLFRHRWRDYRSTVMAFAKHDGNPSTPDASLGVSTIQVTFRDWISPWITLDYLEELPRLGNLYLDRLKPKIDNDLLGSMGRIKDVVGDIIHNKGLVAKQRDYLALYDAAGRVSAPNTSFTTQVAQAVQNAVAIQQTLEYSQAATLGISEPATAFHIFANTATQADIQVDAAKTDLKLRVTQELAKIQERVTFQVQQDQQKFRDELFREDGDIKTACQQSCPTGAIVFGDLNDPESEVSKLYRENSRTYHALEELKVLPSVAYLTKVRNRTEAEQLERVKEEEKSRFDQQMEWLDMKPQVG